VKRLLLLLPILLAGCISSNESGVKVIVGAKLIAAPGREPIPYSVVVIDGGKIVAAGPQQSTPVPKGAAMTRGINMTIEPSGSTPIEPGQPANLILHGPSDRLMKNGEWVQ